MSVPPARRWSTDLTPLCERLARRLRSEGAIHPEAAAVVLAVRGRCGVDQARFAPLHGLDVDELVAIEAGERPWHELPAALHELAGARPGIDLHRLGLEPCRCSGPTHRLTRWAQRGPGRGPHG